MALTDDFHTITLYLVDLIKNDPNEDNILGDVDPNHVYYGDREKIAHVPTYTVFPATQDYELAANTMRTDNRMDFYAIVYYGKVQEVEKNARELDIKTMNLKRLFNSHLTWGGLVSSGYVRRIDPGFAVRGGVLLRATRLSLQGYNRTMLTGAM